MTWVKVGDKPCVNCQTEEQRRNNWKGCGCRYCHWTGLVDVGYQS
jgi:hypothetical protein